MSTAENEGLHALMTGNPIVQKGPVHICYVDGQSLALIDGVAPVSGRYASTFIDSQGVLQLNGMVSTTAIGITIAGPQGGLFDETVPATGYSPANVGSLWTMSFWVAIALRKWRAKYNLPNPRLLAGTNAQGGQSIVQFDDNLPTETGTAATYLYDNQRYFFEQAKATLGADFGGVDYDVTIQGEADTSMTYQAYYDAFMETLKDRRRMISEETGTTPIHCTTQIGSYTNNAGKTYGVKLAQIDVIRDLGGLVLPGWYSFPLADNNVHPSLAESKKMADLIAYYLVCHELGRDIPAIVPKSSVSGSTITLDYKDGLTLGDFLTFDTSGKYVDYGGVTNQGFEVTGTTISSVSLGTNSRSVIIECAGAPSGWSYAMQDEDTTADEVGGVNYGPHRGLLRKEHTITGVLDGLSLHEWAHSWTETF